MKLSDVQTLELPAAADMHVHLRQGEMAELVTPLIRKGGVDTVFVMPNLQPPITTVAQALEYKALLQSIEPKVTYLMSLFLHPSVTPEAIAEAAAAGITGVKLYPQGVTTNSENGVLSVDEFYDTFGAMEKHGIVLNLHGEVGTAPAGVTLEEAFLPTLKKIHQDFPKLRIILEHCSTAAAIEAVRECGPNVAATITSHHLVLTGDHSKVNPLAFCKPIPKTPADRDALLRAVVSGDPKFFLGTDSAPHPLVNKTSGGDTVPAGVFTQPIATQLVLLALEEAVERGVITNDDITQEKLEGFFSRYGRAFYKLPHGDEVARIILERKGERIPPSVSSADGKLEVGFVRADSPIFSVRWV